jgi:16S rRNA C967 or C1407 C5-methylase (RsmB/RsmF family)
MVRVPFPNDSRFYLRVARACRAILIEGAQQDAILARFHEEAGNNDDRRRFTQDVFSVIKHHGLLNYITNHAIRNIDGAPAKDDDRYFLLYVVIFHVFKDRIEKGTYPLFSDGEKEDITHSLANISPRFDAVVYSLVDNATRLDLTALLHGKDVVERWSIMYSHPSWFIDRLRQLLPADRVESILTSHQALEAFFAVARDSEALDRVTRFLSSKNIVFQHDRVFPNVLRISNLAGAKRRVIETTLIDIRSIMIQDLASVAVLEASNIMKGDTIIDACAAPFQKSAGAWWRCGGSGTVIAMEASPQRASINAHRLPVDSREAIHVVVSDAARFGSGFRNVKPDKILLDMPCTGSGSLAAYPELKARQSPKNVAFFSELQARILGSVLDACDANRWNDVRIVYSTCSYYPEEGEEIIDRVMDRIDLADLHDSRGPIARLSLFPAGWKGHACSHRVVRTFPDTNGGSKAFFIAAFMPKI